MAFHDQLNGMPGRTTFIGFLEESLGRAKRGSKHLGLLLLDLDDYGSVNKHYGSGSGAMVLNIIAERLRASVRETDMAAYFGADTFAVALVNPNGISAVAHAAERIRKNLNAPFILKEGVETTIGVSIGIAVYPDNGTDADRLLTVADSAMFESKTGGKNRSAIFKGLTHERADIIPLVVLGAKDALGIAEIDEQHDRLATLINDLHDAIRTSPQENRQKAEALYDELVSSTELHFRTESHLMKEAKYPHSEAHNRTHKFLLDELHYLRSRIIEGNEVQAFQLIKDWLIYHIEKDDVPMGLFLRGNLHHGKK